MEYKTAAESIAMMLVGIALMVVGFNMIAEGVHYTGAIVTGLGLVCLFIDALKKYREDKEED